MCFAHSVPSLTINLLTVYVKVAIRFDLALFAVMGRWPVWKTSTMENGILKVSGIGKPRT